MAEGSTKFKEDYEPGPALESSYFKDLNYWRNLLFHHSLIGQKDGVGYGNVSQRASIYDSVLDSSLPNKRSFIITGSQTGHLEDLTALHYTIVRRYHPRENRIITRGPIRASSESMTHGAIYDADESIRFAFHAHSPDIWNFAERLGIPITDKKVEYGTPEMAEEVFRLFRETNVKDLGIFAMGGHTDGIFSFGETAQRAGEVLFYYLKEAQARAQKPMEDKHENRFSVG